MRENGTDRDVALQMVGTLNDIVSAVSAIALNVVDPVITVQPTNQSVPLNNTVWFEVTAENATSYQWQIDRQDSQGFVDQPESQIWIGTTTRKMHFLSAALREPFEFRCKISNAHGTVYSDAVQFTIPES